VLLFNQVLLDGILLVFPFGIVMILMALIRPMMMGGWNVSMEAMQPKLSKFDLQGWSLIGQHKSK
jgi:flagellar biosynthesis protein FlhB